eukprot:TRINITY_DN4139_c0_g3_i1.p1 TRINITY_DN4139_c0_g3~~TRINITY_DN4139_c0_g3_i1.p1  ORF type:complete len:458 (-),score=113.09 TRINITY_DN4139_c0_g3_i1:190-1563(-)
MFQEAVFGFSLGLLCLLVVVFVPWFWLRRDLQPIRARHPSLVLVIISFASVLSAYSSANGIAGFEKQTCLDALLVSMICIIGLATFFLLRIVMLFVDHQAGKQASSNLTAARDSSSIQHNSVSFIFRFRRYLSAKAVSVFGFIWFLVQFGFLMITLSTTPLLSRNQVLQYSSSDCVDAGKTISINMCVYWLVEIALLAKVIVRLKDIRENFYIKKEFCAYAGYAAFFIAVFFFDYAVNPHGSKPQDTEFIYSVFLYEVFPGIYLILVGICFPLWKSYSAEFSLGKEGGPESGNFLSSETHELSSSTSETPHVSSYCIDRKLANPIVLRAFKEFLIAEFSSENMLFIEQVTEFRTKFENHMPLDEVRAMAEAKKIYELFCTNNSPFCINISGPCRSELCSRMQIELHGADILNVFKVAFVEISEMLRADSWRRFKSSDHYPQVEITPKSVPTMQVTNV